MGAEMDVEEYSHELVRALHARSVDSERIGEVVAEVRSHVAESGEDPRESFGAPPDYASLVAERPNRWADGSTWFAVLLGAATGWLAAQAVFSLVQGEDELLGAPTWVVGVVALALVGATSLAASRAYRPVVDPSSGRRLMPGGGAPTALVLAGLVAAVALVAVPPGP